MNVVTAVRPCFITIALLLIALLFCEEYVLRRRSRPSSIKSGVRWAESSLHYLCISFLVRRLRPSCVKSGVRGEALRKYVGRQRGRSRRNAGARKRPRRTINKTDCILLCVLTPVRDPKPQEDPSQTCSRGKSKESGRKGGS